MRRKASLQDMPKDLDRVRSGLAIKPSGPDAARCVATHSQVGWKVLSFQWLLLAYCETWQLCLQMSCTFYA